MTDPYLSRRSPGPSTRNRETATSITTKADKLLKALRSLHRLDRYAIARTVVDQSSEQGRARRALLRLQDEIGTMFKLTPETDSARSENEASVSGVKEAAGTDA